MKQKWRESLCVLLAALMLILPLAGCSKKEEGADPNGPGAAGTGENGAAEVSLDYTYKPEYIKLDAQIEYMSNLCHHEGTLYFTADVVVGQETDSWTDEQGNTEEWTYDVYETCIFKMNLDGTGLTRLDGYTRTELPEGYDGGFYIERMFVDPDGCIWMVESGWMSHYELPEDFDPETDDEWNYYVDDGQTTVLRKLDGEGSELFQVDLAALSGPVSEDEYSYFYVSGIQTDAQGRIYVAESNESVLYVLNSDGSVAFQLSSEGWIEGLYRGKNGEVYAFGYGDGYALTEVDVETKSWGETFKTPQNFWQFFPGSGEFDLYYNSNVSFFGYDLETGESTRLLNWIDSDINNNDISNIVTLEDGRILATSYVWDETTGEGGMELAILTKVDPATLPEETILTLACMYLDYEMRASIIAFNKSSDQYRITVRDYSEYNTEDDYEAGLTKLSTEIIAGNIPDILCTDSLPISRYAARGLLEDLWPYIEADTELGGREALITEVMDAASIDGKLYQIFQNFSIITTLGAASVVGTEPGWTVDELLECLEYLPEGADIFSESTTKAEILNQCCYMNLDYFVDWSTGQCSFNSPEFIQVLEFANMFPAEFNWDEVDYEYYESDYTRLAQGRQMLARMYVGDYQEYQVLKSILGGSVTFKGYPTQEGSGSAFNISGGLAMSSKCVDKNGAWQFMRTLLTQEYQEQNLYWNFPTNRAAFETQLENAMREETYTDPETGEEIVLDMGSWWIDEETQITIMPTSQEEADAIMDLIRSTDRIYTYDTAIMDIINEDVAAYFAGQKTAQDVANIIQSRVSIYVAEQS